MTMNYQQVEMFETEILDFINPLKSSSSIEERIKLMLQDNSISTVYFFNGELTYRDVEYNEHTIPQWKLSFLDTLEFIGNAFDLFDTKFDQLRIIFKKARLDITFRECKEGSFEERLKNSELEFVIYKYDDVNPYLIEDDGLPY